MFKPVAPSKMCMWVHVHLKRDWVADAHMGAGVHAGDDVLTRPRCVGERFVTQP
jgi:hypothetical protein